MMTSAHLRKFSALPNRAEAQDPHAFDERQQVLWVLAIAKDDPDLGYLTPAEIAEILCDAEGIRISRQRVAAILGKETRTVSRRRSGRRDRFRIMRAGEDELAKATPFSAILVDPQHALSQVRKVEELLNGLKGNLKICDPYVDKKTLDVLAECKGCSRIELLTVNVQGESAFRRDLQAFAREHSIPLTVRVAPAARLHDRYIIHRDGMLISGASLNGLGKKQSFVITTGPDVQAATEAAFDRAWATASAFN
jgi:hypothetical protein